MTPSARHPYRFARRLQLLPLEDRTAPSAAYGQLPLAFEANRGQADPGVDFLARGDGYALALGPTEAVLGLRHAAGGDVLRLQFVGADPSAPAAGSDELVTKTNYLLGSDPAGWRTNVPNYAKVTYDDVYPGIDLVYYGNQGHLEYDFVVDPGVDPGVIGLSVQGAEDITLDGQGNLVLHTAGGEVVQEAPVIYQEIGGVRQLVPGEFVLEGDTGVGFRIGAYDTSRPLVIDPVLSYSTYLGGSNGDQAKAIAVDAAGNAYITGYTYSANFPTTAGAVQGAFGGMTDVFVTKLDADGTQALYSTYLGGSYDEEGHGIAVDAAGNAYVTGYTGSSNFPVSADAFQRTNPAGWFKGFVAKLNSTGSGLVYSTYLGGSSGWDIGRGIAVDAAGNAYVAGDTLSADFPTQNPVQPTHADAIDGQWAGYTDAFVTKLNVSGTALVYSTFLGGYGDEWGASIAVDAAGNAYVGGATWATDPSFGPSFPTTAGAFQTANATPWGNGVAFVTKLNAAGSALDYSTFLGGTTGYDDGAAGIAVDAAGNAYVTGDTQAADFPTTAGAVQRTYHGQIDAFVSALNATGSALVYSTYLGGAGTDQALDIAVDAAGNAHVTGLTESADFPTANAIQPTLGGYYDVFVTKVNPTGSALVTSTFLGGTGLDAGDGIALDSAGNVYVAGTAASANFPTTAGAFQPTSGGAGDDAFVARLDLTVPPPPSSTLSIDDVTVTEGHSGTRAATFTVTRSGDTSEPATVNYATANGTATAGSDYQAASGTLTFAPGETSRTITVLVNGDRLGEPNETFLVNLSQPMNAGINGGQGLGTVLDDEPRMSIGNVTQREGRSGTTLFVFTVTLSAASDVPVTVQFATADGTAKAGEDYVAKSGSLTFAPGETTKTITVQVKGDRKRESDETFFVNLSSPAGALLLDAQGLGVIENDD